MPDTEFDIDNLQNGFDPMIDAFGTKFDKNETEEVDENESNVDIQKNKEKEESEKNKQQQSQQTQQKKNREESTKDLRAQRDKLNKDLEETKQKLASMEEFSSFKEVRDYLKAKTGKDKISNEDVQAYINKNKDRKEKLIKLEQSLQEKESKLKELNIEQSEEWKTVYVKGIQDAVNNINVTVGNFDSSGKARAPELTNKFIKSISELNEDGTPKSAIQLKSMLASFKKEFFDATGMDYESPTINELTKAVENIHDKFNKASNARKDWQATQDQLKKERIFNQAQERKRVIEIEKTNRNLMVRDYQDSEEFKTLNSELDGEYETFLKEEHDFMNSVLDDPKNGQRGYSQLISSLAKAKLTDKALAKIKEQQDHIRRLEKQIENGRPKRGLSTNKTFENADDKDDFDVNNLENGFDPTKELS